MGGDGVAGGGGRGGGSGTVSHAYSLEEFYP